MKRVITYGTFDLFHKGHYNIIKRAKALGDYLIVGVTSESFDIERGKLNVRDSLIKRIENVRRTGLADEIIIEEYQGQKVNDIIKYDIDVLVVGSDWRGKFDYLKNYCDVVYLERTKNISSTKLRSEGIIFNMGIVTDDIKDNDFVQESKYVSGVHVERVFSEDDVKSLDTMLEKGKVSFPFDNGWYLASFYAANGCTIFGDGTDASKGYDFGGDNAVAVTKYIVDLFNNKNFVMDNNEGSLGLAGLKDGSVNAYFNGNWNYDKVKEALGEENVGVAALPTINIGGKDCQLKAFLGSKAIGVNPNCKNQEVAVKLAAFLGSEDAQLAHFKLRGQAPVNKDLATNEEVAADPVAAAMAKVSSDCSVAQPIIDMSGYWDAATPFGDAFQNGAEGQITKDNAAQKTEDFNTQLNDSLK